MRQKALTVQQSQVQNISRSFEYSRRKQIHYFQNNMIFIAREPPGNRKGEQSDPAVYLREYFEKGNVVREFILTVLVRSFSGNCLGVRAS
jgi:hypothetical protein